MTLPEHRLLQKSLHVVPDKVHKDSMRGSPAESLHRTTNRYNSKSTPTSFESYRILTNKDGQPAELPMHTLPSSQCSGRRAAPNHNHSLLSNAALVLQSHKPAFGLACPLLGMNGSIDSSSFAMNSQPHLKIAKIQQYFAVNSRAEWQPCQYCLSTYC